MRKELTNHDIQLVNGGKVTYESNTHMYNLWDNDTGMLLGSFETEDEAMVADRVYHENKSTYWEVASCKKN